MNVLKDSIKIVNQIRGKENLFGYRSTAANQFYLAYCFMGQIYFDTALHKHTRLFWFLWQLSGLLVGIFQLVSYLIYGDMKDIVALLYSVFIMTILIFISVLLPYISTILYSSSLHEALEIADRIITKRKSNVGEILSNELSLGKLFKFICLYDYLTIAIYSLICTMNVMFFYEEEKVKDYRYYLIYLPKLDQYGSLSNFLLINSLTGFIACTLYICWPAISFIIVFYAAIFHNEIQRIIGDLNSLGSNCDSTTETYRNLEIKFKNTVAKCVRDFQDACKMIACLRGFYEAVAAVILPSVLYIEITHAFISVSPNITVSIRIREISNFLTTIQIVYVLCWAGETIDEAARALSIAVYSSPWYWCTTFRKDANILLCQTQRPISAKALGAYLLSLATFLHFMNMIQSAVNVLRQITSK